MAPYPPTRARIALWNGGISWHLHVCTACHVVEATQEYPVLLNPPGPPFKEIANRADLTRASLRHFIATTHWDEKTLALKMPSPELLDSQITDVVAYILSLRTP